MDKRKRGIYSDASHDFEPMFSEGEDSNYTSGCYSRREFRKSFQTTDFPGRSKNYESHEALLNRAKMENSFRVHSPANRSEPPNKMVTDVVLHTKNREQNQHYCHEKQHQTEIEKLGKANENLRNDLNHANDELKRYKDCVTNMENTLFNAQSKIDRQKEEYRKLHNRYSHLFQELEILEKRLKNTEAEREADLRMHSKTSVQQYDSNIKKLQTQILGLHEVISGHEIKKYDYKKQIRDAQNLAAMKEQEIADLEKQLDQMKKKIGKTTERSTRQQTHYQDGTIKSDETIRSEVSTATTTMVKAAVVKPLRMMQNGTGHELSVTELWERIRSLEEENSDLKVKESKEKPEEKIKSDQEIARLQKLLVEKDELIKKVEKEKSEIEQESNQVIAEMADRKRDTHDDSKMKKKYEEKCAEMEHIQQKHASILRKRDQRVAELTERLSMEMEAKVSADESALENICIKSRPTTIANDYELLCSNEWLAAKQALDDYAEHNREEQKLKLLCRVLVIGLEVSSKLQKNCLDALISLIQNPGSAETKPFSTHSTRRAKDTSVSVTNALLNILRLNVDESDLATIVEKICDTVKRELTSCPLHSGRLKTYIKAVASITWKMSIQRPPMTFDQSGEGEMWQGQNKQTVFWKSSDPESTASKVKYYVHPALCHGDILMVKGRVVLEEAYDEALEHHFKRR